MPRKSSLWIHQLKLFLIPMSVLVVSAVALKDILVAVMITLIVFPLGSLLGVNPILIMAAVISGGTFGSHGREIANLMGKNLDVPCYDSEMIKEAANELALSEEEVETKEEKAIRQPETFSNTFFTLGRGSTNTQDKIFDAQRTYIEQVVKEAA